MALPPYQDQNKICQRGYAMGFTMVWRTYTALCRWLHTLWLFTRSDLKTIVIPSSIFGVLGGLPEAGLTIPTGDSDFAIMRRLPLVVAWVWLVLLPFNIDNQRRAAAIDEDRANRPWRPLPSQRLTPDQAFTLMIACHIMALVYSCVVGGLPQSLVGILLGNLYNELGGADRSCVTKNALNALGYVTFTMGAVAVAACSDLAPRSLEWFAMLGAIIFSTVQMQDLPDIEGDAVRGRRTVPRKYHPEPLGMNLTGV
jgi:4-hydroxybenzoate polyprenyltransferase